MDTFTGPDPFATQSQQQNSTVDFDHIFIEPMSNYTQSSYQDAGFSPSPNNMQGSYGPTPSAYYAEPDSFENGSHEDATGVNRYFPSKYSSPSIGSMSLNGAHSYMSMDTSYSPASSRWSGSVPAIGSFSSVESGSCSYSPASIPRQDFGNPDAPAMPFSGFACPFQPVAHGSCTDSSPYGNHFPSNVAQPQNQWFSISSSTSTHNLTHGKHKSGHLDTAADRIDQRLAVTSPSHSVMDSESPISKTSSRSSRPRYCGQCKRDFSSPSNLWRHNKWVHHISKKRYSSRKIPVLRCEPCKKSFNRPDGLKAHQKRRH